MSNIMDIVKFEAMILRAELFPLPLIKQEAILPGVKSSNPIKEEDIWYHLKCNSETKKLEFIYA